MIEIITTLGILIGAGNVQPVLDYIHTTGNQTDRREEETKQKTPPEEKITTETLVEEYFKEDPILVRIAWCESKIKHFEEDGTVLRGTKTPKDVGVMQINEYYHGQTAQKLGIDLHSLEGNLAYAKYLYQREGTQPWKPSRHCWSNHKIALKR